MPQGLHRTLVFLMEKLLVLLDLTEQGIASCLQRLSEQLRRTPTTSRRKQQSDNPGRSPLRPQWCEPSTRNYIAVSYPSSNEEMFYMFVPSHLPWVDGTVENELCAEANRRRRRSCRAAALYRSLLYHSDESATIVMEWGVFYWRNRKTKEENIERTSIGFEFLRGEEKSLMNTEDLLKTSRVEARKLSGHFTFAA
jgi:hypothetical protein